MAMNLSHASLVGRIGRDPEQRQVGEQLVADFTLAVGEARKVGGEWKEHTSWFKVTGWNNVARKMLGSDGRPGLAKGMLVAVGGRLRIEEWTARDGKQGTTVVVVADHVEKLRDGKTERTSPDEPGAAPAATSRQATPASAADDEPPF